MNNESYLNKTMQHHKFFFLCILLYKLKHESETLLNYHWGFFIQKFLRDFLMNIENRIILL